VKFRPRLYRGDLLNRARDVMPCLNSTNRSPSMAFRRAQSGWHSMKAARTYGANNVEGSLNLIEATVGGLANSLFFSSTCAT